MANADDVRRLALTLPGTVAVPHFDRAAFRVERIYATLDAAGLSLNLKLTPDEQEFKAMMSPEAFAPLPNKWGQQGWTSVDLAAVGIEELDAALRLAWEHGQAKTPKKR